MSSELASPHLALEAHDAAEAFSTEVETAPVEIIILGLPAQCGLHRVSAAATAIDHPLQHAHVLSEARPCESAVIVGAKPVDAEDARRMSNCLAHRQPVLEVVADVIAAERQHRERIPPYLADFSARCRRRLRSHRCGFVYTVRP